MSRGTLFNPSSPSIAPAVGGVIKAQVCKNAQVRVPTSRSPQYYVKSCAAIIDYAKSSLSTLKTEILKAHLGPTRRMCV